MKSTNIQIEKSFINLINTVAKLRSDQGCPWDLEQTSKSLGPYIIEEAYELLEAIEELSASDKEKVAKDIPTSSKSSLGIP